jgi:hypothetical protein
VPPRTDTEPTEVVPGFASPLPMAAVSLLQASMKPSTIRIDETVDTLSLDSRADPAPIPAPSVASVSMLPP